MIPPCDTTKPQNPNYTLDRVHEDLRVIQNSDIITRELILHRFVSIEHRMQFAPASSLSKNEAELLGTTVAMFLFNLLFLAYQDWNNKSCKAVE
jgi:hypothetical protein